MITERNDRKVDSPPQRSGAVRRTVCYLWAAPNTCFAVGIGLLLLARFRVVQGVIEMHGPGVAWVLRRLPVSAAAMTLGYAVFGCDRLALERTRTHEHVHVRQYGRWGPLFVPAYLGWSLWLYVRGRDGYRENPFEIEAYALDSLLPPVSVKESKARRPDGFPNTPGGGKADAAADDTGRDGAGSRNSAGDPVK
ncbi:hypothetical protein [Roseiconus nitratireducens]|uniref:hypothetical protein n=1 Tax=Roseiconus nitratireducens TaxID=2605748 RepID=UPI0028F42480|nr:hypothetical protein [Roseiconus nitratireducens]